MTRRSSDLPQEALGLVTQLEAVATSPDEVEIGRLLAGLKSLTNGQWAGLVRDLRPDLKRPDAWASRCLRAFRAATPTPQERAGLAPQPESRSLGDETAPAALDERALTRFARLRPLLRLSGKERRHQVERAAADLGVSTATVYRDLQTLRRDGARALNRQRRRDAGKIRVSPEAQAFFLARRTAKETRHESIEMSIRATRLQFPHQDISASSLRRLNHTIPAALRMNEDQWRKTFLPGKPVEVPHVNHTHTFDFTHGDLFVWDGDPQVKPYRPWLIAIVDERTQALLFGLYTRGRETAPNTADLMAVLLHAWLPKPNPSRWPMCGIPKYLHCDNGKVQTSDWLKAVCRTLNVDLGLTEDIRHTEVYSGWMQGHAERVFGIVHGRFESQLGPAYCGNDPLHKPDCHIPPHTGGPKLWRQYPTLEALNYAFRVWVESDYLPLHHRRLQMSRIEAWQQEAPGHVILPEDATDYLYTVLLQRDGTRRVRRGRVQLLGFTYWHQVLQGYEGSELEVRYDPADLGRAMIMGFDGQPLCWAEREESISVDNARDMAELRHRRRQKKAERRILKEASGVISTVDQGTFEQTVEQFRQARRESGIVAFPTPVKTVKPDRPEADADAIIDLLGGADETDEERYGFSIQAQ